MAPACMPMTAIRGKRPEKQGETNPPPPAKKSGSGARMAQRGRMSTVSVGNSRKSLKENRNFSARFSASPAPKIHPVPPPVALPRDRVPLRPKGCRPGDPIVRNESLNHSFSRRYVNHPEGNPAAILRHAAPIPRRNAGSASVRTSPLPGSGSGVIGHPRGKDSGFFDFTFSRNQDNLESSVCGRYAHDGKQVEEKIVGFFLGTVC